MGLWWKNVDATPPESEERFATFVADPEAASKKWPILWRFCQNWHIIKVAAKTKPYKLYFRSASGRTMQYRWRIFSDFVAVRVGTEDVIFWATYGTGVNPLIYYRGLVIPALFFIDKRKLWEKEEIALLKGQISYI